MNSPTKPIIKYWIEYGGEKLKLRPGQNLVGSDSRCDIRISHLERNFAYLLTIEDDKLFLIDLNTQISKTQIIEINGQFDWLGKESVFRSKVLNDYIVIDHEIISDLADEENLSVPKHLEIDQAAPNDFIDSSGVEESVFKIAGHRLDNRDGLEIMLLSYGNVIENKLVLLENVFNRSAKKVFGREFIDIVPTLSSSNPLFSGNNGEFAFEISGFDGPQSFALEDLSKGLLFTNKNLQLFFRKTEIPAGKIVSSINLEDELKRNILYFALLFFPLFFILNFIDLPEVKELEETPIVIYRPKAEESQVASAESAPKASQEDTKEKTEKVEKQEKKTKSKTKVAKQKKTTKKTQKVAKSKPAPPKPRLNLKSKFGKFMSSNSADASEVKKFKSQSSSTSSNFGGVETGVTGRKVASVGGKLKSKISGFGGKGNLKYKGSGVGNKRGFDSSFSSTRTVVMGSIDPDVLRKILREYIPQFQYCYQNELISNPGLSGVLDLRFTINKHGRVSKSRIKSKTGKFRKSGRNCVAKVLDMIQFPKPKGGGIVEVRQPLNFTSDRSKV